MTKRLAFFVYGIACYAVFFGTTQYAIGFVGNFGVRTTLDGNLRGSLGAALATDLGLLALFAVQHSVMARPWFKKRWTTLIPEPIERSTYVLFSSLALIVMFWLWRPIGGIVWSVDAPLARFVLWSLFACGWVLVFLSSFLINHFDLFGLRQVWLFLRGLPYTKPEFATPLPYRLVRHPLYVGWLFAFWMTPTMSISHLVFTVATTAYILIAIQLEERDLLQEHGPSYEAYRRRVPMLVPGLGRRETTTVESTR